MELKLPKGNTMGRIYKNSVHSSYKDSGSLYIWTEPAQQLRVSSWNDTIRNRGYDSIHCDFILRILFIGKLSAWITHHHIHKIRVKKVYCIMQSKLYMSPILYFYCWFSRDLGSPTQYQLFFCRLNVKAVLFFFTTTSPVGHIKKCLCHLF